MNTIFWTTPEHIDTRFAVMRNINVHNVSTVHVAHNFMSSVWSANHSTLVAITELTEMLIATFLFMSGVPLLSTSTLSPLPIWIGRIVAMPQWWWYHIYKSMRRLISIQYAYLRTRPLSFITTKKLWAKCTLTFLSHKGRGAGSFRPSDPNNVSTGQLCLHTLRHAFPSLSHQKWVLETARCLMPIWSTVNLDTFLATICVSNVFQCGIWWCCVSLSRRLKGLQFYHSLMPWFI